MCLCYSKCIYTHTEISNVVVCMHIITNVHNIFLQQSVQANLCICIMLFVEALKSGHSLVSKMCLQFIRQEKYYE